MFYFEIKPESVIDHFRKQDYLLHVNISLNVILRLFSLLVSDGNRLVFAVAAGKLRGDNVCEDPTAAVSVPAKRRPVSLFLLQFHCSLWDGENGF